MTIRRIFAWNKFWCVVSEMEHARKGRSTCTLLHFAFILFIGVKWSGNTFWHEFATCDWQLDSFERQNKVSIMTHDTKKVLQLLRIMPSGMSLFRIKFWNYECFLGIWLASLDAGSAHPTTQTNADIFRYLGWDLNPRPHWSSCPSLWWPHDAHTVTGFNRDVLWKFQLKRKRVNVFVGLTATPMYL